MANIMIIVVGPNVVETSFTHFPKQNKKKIRQRNESVEQHSVLVASLLTSHFDSFRNEVEKQMVVHLIWTSSSRLDNDDPEMVKTHFFRCLDGFSPPALAHLCPATFANSTRDKPGEVRGGVGALSLASEVEMGVSYPCRITSLQKVIREVSQRPTRLRR